MTNIAAAPVTVVVPLHNRAGLIEEALAGVWAQRPALPAQVIVVDDASDDDGAERAERAGAKVVKLEENVGPGGARDHGLAEATQPWVAFLDSDDLWAPNHLATLLSATALGVGCSLVVSSGLSTCGGRLRVTGNPYRRRHFLPDAAALLCPENVVTTSACMVDTNLARQVGGFGASRLAEDLDLWLRLLDRAPGWAVPEITVRYGGVDGADVRVRASDDSIRMRSAARRVVEAHASLGPRATTGIAVCAEWDTLRIALRERQRGEAAKALKRLAGLGAWTQLVQMLVHRRVCRTRWRSQIDAARELFGDHLALPAETGRSPQR